MNPCQGLVTSSILVTCSILIFKILETNIVPSSNNTLNCASTLPFLNFLVKIWKNIWICNWPWISFNYKFLPRVWHIAYCFFWFETGKNQKPVNKKPSDCFWSAQYQCWWYSCRFCGRRWITQFHIFGLCSALRRKKHFEDKGSGTCKSEHQHNNQMEKGRKYSYLSFKKEYNLFHFIISISTFCLNPSYGLLYRNQGFHRIYQAHFRL